MNRIAVVAGAVVVVLLVAFLAWRTIDESGPSAPGRETEQTEPDAPEPLPPDPGDQPAAEPAETEPEKGEIVVVVRTDLGEPAGGARTSSSAPAVRRPLTLTVAHGSLPPAVAV